MKPEYDNKSLGFLIGFLNRQGRKYFEHNANKFGFHGGQLIILKNLEQQDGISQNELSKKLLFDKAHIARALKILEDKALITRCASDKDCRLNKIFLTPAGKKIIPEIRSIYMEWTNKLGFNFSDEENILVHSLLVRMCENVELIKEELR